jgi:hypothetical protein
MIPLFHRLVSRLTRGAMLRRSIERAGLAAHGALRSPASAILNAQVDAWVNEGGSGDDVG